MTFSHPTKIEPAPLPNGGKGGLLGMAGNKFAKVHEAERKALDAKHEVDRIKLAQKHQEQRASAIQTAKPAPKKK
jgi:hypothetical protein